MAKKKILLIYTGGTIGMSKTSNGYAPMLEAFHETLRNIPELYSDNMPAWDIIDLNPVLDSSNMTVNEWNKIGKVIENNYEAYAGFVVLHGTDTMAYTASALSFMLEGCNKPVVLTGSQIPLCEIRNDARDNLITAMLIAADSKVHEVCLYFGGRLIRGNRAIKASSDELTAFASPNFDYLAEANIEVKYNRSLLRKKSDEAFSLRRLKNVPIGVIKVFPGIQFELFDSIMVENLKGVVIETFGTGNIPDSGDALLPIIKKAAANGTVIVVCSQCPRGAVSLGAYEVSSALEKAGAVSGNDMTTEAAVAKLYYLFSCGYSQRTVKKKMAENLRGELSPV